MSKTTYLTNFQALLKSQACDRPDAIAVVDGTRQISFAEFVADIDKVARRLNSHALSPGQRAVLFFSSSYLHWLAVMALWRLGVVSVSVENLGDIELMELLRANALITERGNLKVEGGAMILMGEDWLAESSDALPPAAERPFDANQPTRIVLSSGTTGMPKKIMFSNALIDLRIHSTIANYGIVAANRFMSVVGLSSIGGFVYSVATWAAGGSVALFNAQQGLDGQIAQMRPNLVFMSPVQLSNLAAAMPADFAHPDLTLIVAGGRLPQKVAELARERLASAIWVVYGSTEAGTVTIAFEPEYTNPDIVGPLVPTAELQIVDEAGQPVAPGALGEVRMGGVCCATGYQDDPEASRVSFRDGWFYPGDLGCLSESGVLSIVGRVGDVLNLGGVKVARGVIEDALMSCRGVKDVTAFSVPDNFGTETLWVAVVPAEGYAEEELQHRYYHQFPTHGAPNVVLLDAIPRNSMAKVRSNQLRDMVMRRLQQEAATAVPAFGLRAPQDYATTLANIIMKTEKVWVDDKEYVIATLPETAKGQLAALQFIDTELWRLNMQREALQTARSAFLRVVGEVMRKL